ncbi:hypothetical protein K6Q96_00465 [Grimontia kaedaensis]|uniref:Uncharacterized protein n=1 Tax=Grimontia kaedaensis TaxID=2872157 RepID=A0ABY4WVT2_9GAMM|nr:hypothetical protein [Grimontia kaedaensis]USH02556.1 hypothetical protein K6Q96_00465 [Grimontia kaedaensis]
MQKNESSINTLFTIKARQGTWKEQNLSSRMRRNMMPATNLRDEDNCFTFNDFVPLFLKSLRKSRRKNLCFKKSYWQGLAKVTTHNRESRVCKNAGLKRLVVRKIRKKKGSYGLLDRSCLFL